MDLMLPMLFLKLDLLLQDSNISLFSIIFGSCAFILKIKDRYPPTSPHLWKHKQLGLLDDETEFIFHTPCKNTKLMMMSQYCTPDPTRDEKIIRCVTENVFKIRRYGCNSKLVPCAFTMCQFVSLVWPIRLLNSLIIPTSSNLFPERSHTWYKMSDSTVYSVLASPEVQSWRHFGLRRRTTTTKNILTKQL